MAIKIDIKQGSTITRDKNGDRYTRIAHISGVVGNVDQLLLLALDDAAMPNYGDPHPADANATLQTITVQPIGGGRYRAQMEYFNDPASASGSANANASVNATTALEEVSKDRLGNALETVYIVSNSSFSWSNIQPRWQAEVEMPRVTFDFDYVTNTFPKTEIDTYLARVNSAIWNGYAVRTILCSAINVTQNGNEYRVRFSFAHNPDTWDFVGVAPDAPGNIVSSTDPGFNTTTGEKIFELYDTVDFGPLGFTL